MITTHVLDISRGKPAADVGVTLFLLGKDGWQLRSVGRTDQDGRCRSLLAGPPEPGQWRIVFDTGGWFEKTGVEGFYPEVSILFVVKKPEHHHVPLLLSPYGYSTYRGT